MVIDLDKSYLFQLRRLTRALDKAFDQTLRQHVGISLTNYILLSTINEHPHTSPQEVAEFLDITPGAISRQIEAAIKTGWVAMRDDDGDRRRRLLDLTPAGKKMFQDGTNFLLNIRPTIVEGIDKDATLHDHISAMQRNIETVRHP